MWQVGTHSSIAHVDAVGSSLDGTFSRKDSLGTLPNPNGGIESAPVKKIRISSRVQSKSTPKAGPEEAMQMWSGQFPKGGSGEAPLKKN